MLGSFFSGAPTPRPRYFICQIAALILTSTCLPAQNPASPTPTPKAASEKSKPNPDDSASASLRTLVQFNDALENLAAKVSPAVVQILVTGYGPLHEENRTQTALIVRQHAVGSGVIVDPIRIHHDQRARRRRRATHSRRLAAARRFRPPRARGQTPHPRSPPRRYVHKETDLALLKIDEKDLPTLPLLATASPRRTAGLRHRQSRRPAEFRHHGSGERRRPPARSR
jgi:hypothetical protein